MSISNSDLARLIADRVFLDEAKEEFDKLVYWNLAGREFNGVQLSKKFTSEWFRTRNQTSLSGLCVLHDIALSLRSFELRPIRPITVRCHKCKEERYTWYEMKHTYVCVTDANDYHDLRYCDSCLTGSITSAITRMSYYADRCVFIHMIHREFLCKDIARYLTSMMLWHADLGV